jgi:hypothetical protein
VTYVFVFVGEFGYEVLNWQGVVQKFLRLRPKARVICASRGQVAALYPGATYVDIGDVPRFRASVARGYYAVLENDVAPASEANVALDDELRRDLRAAILARMRERHGWRVTAMVLRGTRFVFSSSKSVLEDCVFGADRRLFGSVPGEGNIYDALDLRNNLYGRVVGSAGARERLQERIDFDLSQSFVLVQSRRRETHQRSIATVDEDGLVSALAAKLPVVQVNFQTGRAKDSYSRFPDGRGAHTITVSDFDEQAALITAASHCVFISEGDFGSHIYVPPILGRDVVSVAPRDVYALGTTPISFWNRNVFRFGGQIEPIVAEDLDRDALAARFEKAAHIT